MEETLRADSIKKRLSMQNKVLKRLEEFSEKMQKRANDVTMEVNGLLDQAGVVELDLKNTFNSFRNLSRYRFIEHRVSDENDVPYHMDSSKHSVEAGIPAQSYETDILPRYKEALSLGLASYRNHLKNTNKSYSTSSIFRIGSGPLPHIIGSEEYIHDNSCGLTEDLAPGTSLLDFSYLLEPREVCSDTEQHDMLWMQQGVSEKDGNEPLVSAALDFKAMLEAALLNPYKLYDEESLLLPDVVSNNDNKSPEQTHKDVDQVSSRALHAVPAGSSQHFNVTEDTNVPINEENLTSVHEPHKLYTALISGSLFDTEEESLSSSQKQPIDIHASVAESTQGHEDTIVTSQTNTAITQESSPSDTDD